MYRGQYKQTPIVSISEYSQLTAVEVYVWLPAMDLTSYIPEYS